METVDEGVRERCRRTVPSLIVVSMKLPVTNSIVCVHQKKMYVYIINKWNIELMGFGVRSQVSAIVTGVFQQAK